jgi:hypothetical protein
MRLSAPKIIFQKGHIFGMHHLPKQVLIGTVITLEHLILLQQSEERPSFNTVTRKKVGHDEKQSAGL